MGLECSTHGTDEKRVKKLVLEDPDVDGKITFEWIFREMGLEGMGWINLYVDRDQWRVLVNMLIKSGFHKMREFA
jgi:hypothetical protein